MASTAEDLEAPQTDEVASHLVQPEVQKYLEAVYAVAPFPEEYVRYRLHLATALPLQLIDAWFENRRQNEKENEGFESSKLEAAPQGASGDSRQRAPANFSLFGAQRLESNESSHTAGVPAQDSTEEMADVGQALAMMQSAHQSGELGSPPKAFYPLPKPSVQRTGTTEVGRDVGSGEVYANTKSRRRSHREEAAPSANRFDESDLGLVASLVGLETLTSTEEHCGSRSLYMFEQLTALDSLDNEGGGSKRRRTRHQHFWRNTDKLDKDDRVYIPTSSIKPAWTRRECVAPKHDISQDERTNAWTVCLTTRGVIGYLNKRISPLGVRMVRALLAGAAMQPGRGGMHAVQTQQWEAARQTNTNSSLRTQEKEEEQEAVPPKAQRPKLMRATADDFVWEPRYGLTTNGSAHHPSSYGSGADEGAPDIGQQRQQHLEAASTLAAALGSHQETGFEPIPRARKRKPG